MSYQTKRAALSSEALRRLRNTSEELPWAVKAEILSEFSHKLRCSGWDEKSRYDFIMAGLTGYRRQLKREPRLGSAPSIALGSGIACREGRRRFSRSVPGTVLMTR